MMNMNKTQTIYIRSWRDFTKVVKLLAGEGWMFRGQRDADWALDSTLDRYSNRFLRIVKLDSDTAGFGIIQMCKMNVKAKQNRFECGVLRILDGTGAYQHFLAVGSDPIEPE